MKNRDKHSFDIKIQWIKLINIWLYYIKNKMQFFYQKTFNISAKIKIQR